MRRTAKAAAIAAAAAVSAAAAAVSAAAIERRFIAAPHYRGPRSDHFDGERFHNLEEGVQHGLAFLKWQTSRQPGFWPEYRDVPPGPPPPARVGGGALRLTFVNHSTTLIQMDGVNVLTDPVWSRRVSPVSFAGPRRHRPPGIRLRDLPPIDVVLVSHNHYDHLDTGTLHALRWRHRPRIVTALGNGRFLARAALGPAIELDWWQAVPLGELVVTCVPARHFSARGLSDRDRNLWSGFVISAPSGHVYFAGDTGWGAHFERIAERFDPIRLARPGNDEGPPAGGRGPRRWLPPAKRTILASSAIYASTNAAGRARPPEAPWSFPGRVGGMRASYFAARRRGGGTSSRTNTFDTPPYCGSVATR